MKANFANVDAAIMLDHQGFVAELNDTNLFMIRDGKLFTPFADACLHGITRGLVLSTAQKLGIEVAEKNLSLVEFYNADEVFATGTMGELTPVNEIDGRAIENKSGMKLRAQLQEAFSKLIPDLCEQL